MILTICVLYPMIALLSVFVFLLSSLELQDILFWCHELIPLCFGLVPILTPFFNFLMAWFKFMWNIFQTCFYIAMNVLSFVVSVFSIGFPLVSKPLRVTVSFFRWMCSELFRGIYATGNPILTLFSWIMLTCACVLCLDRVVTQRFQNNRRDRIRRPNELEVLNRHYENGNDNNEENDDQENENAENRLIEIRQRLLNRQLNHTATNQNRENPQQNQNDRNNTNRVDNFSENDAADRHLCIICIENVKNYAVFPCGHLQFCRVCVENLFRLSSYVKCPVCNGNINEYRRIYA